MSIVRRYFDSVRDEDSNSRDIADAINNALNRAGFSTRVNFISGIFMTTWGPGEKNRKRSKIESLIDKTVNDGWDMRISWDDDDIFEVVSG